MKPLTNSLTPLLAFALLWLASPALAQSRTVVDLTGPGWTLWLDEDARWQDEELFLPGTPLADIPVRPPTGGWEALEAALRGPAATSVAVPGTVEEYLRRATGPTATSRASAGGCGRPRPFVRQPAPLRSSSSRCASAPRSSWTRRSSATTSSAARRSRWTSRPPSSRGGTHRLAVRVTDPGGNFDWRDGASISWGRYRIPGSHGFGGVTGACAWSAARRSTSTTSTCRTRRR